MVDKPQQSAPVKARRWARILVIQLGLTAALLAGLEGLASLVVPKRDAAEKTAEPDTRVVAERRHTIYDPLLGWVNQPNLSISNLYGPDLHVSINNLGFRGTDAIDPNQPDGTRRIIVSGDSFTFGYGVGDHSTWAASLARRTPDCEILNMGLGGYGLDQAYLWYRRDGDPLPHDVHLFAFITENFRRMSRDRFMGYGKPVLTAREGRLVVENVPPPWPNHARRLPARYQAFVQNLNLVRLIQGQLERWRGERIQQWGRQVQEAIVLTFVELHQLHAAAGRTGALVYLPVEKDYRSGDSNAWRSLLAREATTRGWIFIDLVKELRDLPREDVPGLFIQTDDDRFRGVKGHYTEAGNDWVARTLHRHLLAHPQLAARLNATARCD